MACGEAAMDAPSGEMYKWMEEDTRSLILWRASNASLFTGRRNAAVNGYETYIAGRNLEGKVTPAFLKKKWENLKQKYKDLKSPRTGVSTEGGETTAASWKWYTLMDEAIGGRPSITPPVLIASSSQDVAVIEPPSVVTPEQGTSTTSTPKRRRVDVVEVLKDLQERDQQYEQELREMEARAVEREEARAREAAAREERRWQETMEREERRHREGVEREQRFLQEMREREERRDRETAVREERFLAVLEKLLKK